LIFNGGSAAKTDFNPAGSVPEVFTIPKLIEHGG
jgi:hypothetical protein